MKSLFAIEDKIKNFFALPDKNVKIALVMAVPLLRDSFSSSLSDLGYLVESCHGSGKELIASLSADYVPDVVLLDVSGPPTDAVNTTTWLKEQYPSVKVLALCMDDDEPLLKPVLESGARGYIPVSAFSLEIQDAIWVVRTNGYYARYWKNKGDSGRK